MTPHMIVITTRIRVFRSFTRAPHLLRASQNQNSIAESNMTILTMVMYILLGTKYSPTHECADLRFPHHRGRCTSALRNENHTRGSRGRPSTPPCRTRRSAARRPGTSGPRVSGQSDSVLLFTLRQMRGRPHRRSPRRRSRRCGAAWRLQYTTLPWPGESGRGQEPAAHDRPDGEGFEHRAEVGEGDSLDAVEFVFERPVRAGERPEAADALHAVGRPLA